jgi:hypothetical protein
MVARTMVIVARKMVISSPPRLDHPSLSVLARQGLRGSLCVDDPSFRDPPSTDPRSRSAGSREESGNRAWSSPLTRTERDRRGHGPIPCAGFSTRGSPTTQRVRTTRMGRKRVRDSNATRRRLGPRRRSRAPRCSHLSTGVDAETLHSLAQALDVAGLPVARHLSLPVFAHHLAGREPRSDAPRTISSTRLGRSRR